MLKVDEKQCELDMLHDEQVRLGENKYSTLKKVNTLNMESYNLLDFYVLVELKF